MDKENFYLVPEKDLLNMLEIMAKYSALEAGGVDNWAWYSDSLRDGLELAMEEPDVKRMIDDMESEGVQGYRDDFDYFDLAKWAIGGYEKVGNR